VCDFTIFLLTHPQT